MTTIGITGRPNPLKRLEATCEKPKRTQKKAQILARSTPIAITSGFWLKKDINKNKEKPPKK